MIMYFGPGIKLNTKDVSFFESQDAFDKFQKDNRTPHTSFLGVFVLVTDSNKIGFREFNAFDYTVPSISQHHPNSYNPAENERILELQVIYGVD